MKAIATLLAALALAACTAEADLIIPFTVLDEGVQSGIHPDTHAHPHFKTTKPGVCGPQHKTIAPRSILRPKISSL